MGEFCATSRTDPNPPAKAGSEVAKPRTRRLQAAILQAAIRAILCHWRARGKTIGQWPRSART
eukprot:5929539-Alexandrium_andersonii.AAC.1